MKILLAEDEEMLSRAVATVLTHRDYEVDTALNGQEAVSLAREKVYDCIVLDIMMPVMDGLEALRILREGGDRTPVILLTAKSELEDRIGGLDAGADDYLTKPFAMGELEARIRTQIRRREVFQPKILQLGNVKFDPANSELSAENAVRLSQKEGMLLSLFLTNPEKKLSREEIFRRIWAEERELSEELVWVYVSYLKNKLASVAGNVSIFGEKEGPYCLREEET